MPLQKIQITNMTKDDLDLAMNWANGEGWNPGLFDADTFFPTDPGGFFTAKLNREHLGFISVVNYDSNFSFAGLFIVRKDARGQGVGRLLIERALTHVKAANTGTDGVPKQEENYKKIGFKTAYKNLRWTGKIAVSSEIRPEIMPITHRHTAEVFEFDSLRFPTPRGSFIRRWIFQKQSCALGFFRGERLCGYGVIRPAHEGARIGPLSCQSQEIARALIVALANRFPNQTIFIDVPEPNAAALEMVSSFGMKKTFETVRMYTGEAPNLKIGEIFGVTTLELG